MQSAMRNRNAAHVDFAALRGIFSNALAMPSNIDMVLERHGKFLIGEWKRPNEAISAGQKIMLLHLAMMPDFTVLIIEGDTDEDMVIHNVWQLTPHRTLKPITSSIEAFKTYLSDWFNAA